MTANGASAFATLDNPLQRIWRDSEIAARHAQVEPEVAKLTKRPGDVRTRPVLAGVFLSVRPVSDRLNPVGVALVFL